MPAWLKDFLQDMEQDRKDRSMVIVYTIGLETVLYEIIKSFLIDDKGKVEDLLDDGRLLGTLSNKIQLAYCLGLISKDEYHDLDIVRKIRNEFAHSSKTLALNKSKRISDLCNALLMPNKIWGFSALPKGKFIATTIMLRQNLEQRLIQAKTKRCKTANEIKKFANMESIIPILARKD